MTDSALAYLTTVKDAFKDDREKYDKFLELVKNFTAERFNLVRGIEEVKELLKGYRDLILGFNVFLPKGYEIKLPLEDEQPPEKKLDVFVKAKKLLHKIKARFHGQDNVYKTFLAILKMHKDGTKSPTAAYGEITALLQHHADLLNELPFLSLNTSRTISIHFTSAQNSLFREKSSAVPIVQQMCVLKRKRTKTSHDDHNHIVGHRLESDWSEREKDNRDYYQDGIQKLLSLKRTHFCMAEDLMARSFCNVDKHFGMHPMPSTCYDQSSMKSSERFSFCAKIKDKLQNPKNYFSKHVDIYSKEKTTRQELPSSTTDFPRKFPDLMKGFNECVTQCKKMNESSRDEEHVQKQIKLEDWNRDRHHDGDDRVKETVSDCRKRDKSTVVANKNVSGRKLSLYASKKKNSAKSVRELDLSICEKCTPSYYLLPKEFQIPSSSRRTKLDAEVLNDHWKCVAPSIKDYSSKHMSKNLNEMTLFECEDDRIELDMCLETAKSTTKQVEELIEKINTNMIERDNPINIEKHLIAQNLRCIEQLYGDHGIDVLDVLRKNASQVLPVILTRLKQKHEEWARCRADLNKLWAEVYAKNYHKSLNHDRVPSTRNQEL
ncbi:hypothetical protein AAZX31_08G283300 [Glycine max]|nr:paired amphipathic helix protein Sin3-like 3 [Glycine max]XP_028245691.1 paired amphipathic helix protein Sin3-like 3 [Glycine soja]KAH1053709.1 hypothetical protein GYH30_022788 [Glycine max]KRH45779.2 hypothetical protein GLYMA_08G293100v4 [Glycine max]KRH45780.1 hypothetical protein GLYMA_08G293100v4 [Glycine max]|eukprot:XP_006585985.2 paired amphipathic helix protein Sin3-like 3 [Glycine max]